MGNLGRPPAGGRPRFLMVAFDVAWTPRQEINLELATIERGNYPMLVG